MALLFRLGGVAQDNMERLTSSKWLLRHAPVY